MRVFYSFLVVLAASSLLAMGTNHITITKSEIANTPTKQNHTWIAFTSYRDGRREIYEIAPYATDAHRLTDTSDNDFPVWSPDGKKITFESLRADDSKDYEINAVGTN